MKRIGLDIGSTTIKCVVLDEENRILFSEYRRHFSQISTMTSKLLVEIGEKFPKEKMELAMSGSAGMGMASDMEIDFVQEVYATRLAVNGLHPGIDIVIELGGEDAKILFLTNGLEVRMNGSCAGGTGAFIDQMATLMKIDTNEMNEMAKNHDKIYTIASRCGVFAKSDIQPLINQGARLENIAASIFYSVVNQTIGGLAQGREIKGKVLYLGGPLTFLSELRESFDKTLGLTGFCPENSLCYVAMGAAMAENGREYDLKELAEKLGAYASKGGYISCPPLFESEKDYEEFVARHNKDSKNVETVDKIEGPAYLGIDAGSTTVKAVVCDEEGRIVAQYYEKNSGNPVPIVKEYLENIYERFPGIQLTAGAVTGYGEDIIRNAFHLDYGIVETMAHYKAAQKIRPNVDFIIDIGGQDIKCFKVHNGAIDNIFLNEACSSGCGSFLQTFAEALNYKMKDFAKLGLMADKPADLGSRCTVFMNSSVKQAQKDGAKIENISAGLSISVVKNALYKVIRCATADQLGENIVVQGGTFLNDAVLRAFEQEVGRNVIRPNIAGLMGAYGAALYAKERLGEEIAQGRTMNKSTMLTLGELKDFTHKVNTINCKGCSNHCQLTVNTFKGGDRYIAGNRCEKPLNGGKEKAQYNLFDYKLKLLDKYRDNRIEEGKITLGIPMGLNMYELLPFWYTLLKKLGFNVVVSSNSSRDIFLKGQNSIPSDTVCFPAKLIHGHIEELIDKKVDGVFYPCMTYNLDEGKGDNHYNCPVVAYYPEVVGANMSRLKEVKFISDYMGIHNKKAFPKHFAKAMENHLGVRLSHGAVKTAMEDAFEEYNKHMEKIRCQADKYLAVAKETGMPVIALCGRPYHIDPEINHGIDKMICQFGAIVITEDSISNKVEKFPTAVLNQWTYHSRLYAAAKVIARNKIEGVNVNLIQLVSFGCGVDAVTTDETRRIIEENRAIYTQIKIDEITNMGAARIRIRSLFAAAKIHEDRIN